MKEIASMHHVTFSYDTEEEGSSLISNKALDDVSFTLYEGQWLAIVGHNGSGKSTLAKLLIGLMFPSSGEVNLFLESLSEENLWEMRSKMGIVFQNPDNQFVGSTVQDDVAFALENNGVPHEMMVKRVHEALEQVKMTDYVNHEPHHLSGGQKQRVAIAGALALQPELLILDEATSSVDTRTEQQIQTAMDQLMKNRTSFVIAHRLSTIKNADLILVLKDGDIIESGTHEALLERGGFYAELYNSQFEVAM